MEHKKFRLDDFGLDENNGREGTAGGANDDEYGQQKGRKGKDIPSVPGNSQAPANTRQPSFPGEQPQNGIGIPYQGSYEGIPIDHLNQNVGGDAIQRRSAPDNKGKGNFRLDE